LLTKWTKKKLVDEEKIAHKVDEEKIAHKVKADEKIIAHKINEEKITQKVKVNNKGNMDGVMATKITNKNKETNKNKIEGETELGLLNLKFPDKVQLLNDPNIWIGDTAATVHMTPYSVGMIQQKCIGSQQGITVGNGTQEKTVMQGTIKGNIVNKNGVKMGVAMLTDLSYAPTMKFNLCSLSKLMVNGWKMEGYANSITMKKQGRVLNFDIVVRTTTRLVFCMYLERMNNEFSFSTLTNRIPWSLLEVHERLGHPNKDATRDMVKGLGVTVKPGVMGVCWACTVAKVKQKNVCSSVCTREVWFLGKECLWTFHP